MEAGWPGATVSGRCWEADNYLTAGAERLIARTRRAQTVSRLFGVRKSKVSFQFGIPHDRSLSCSVSLDVCLRQ